METANEIGVLFAPGRASEVDVGDFKDEDKDGESGSDKDGDNNDGDEDGLGGERDRAGTGDGLGDDAMGLELSWTALTAGLVLCGVLL
jgi:hypothetical protein